MSLPNRFLHGFPWLIGGMILMILLFYTFYDTPYCNIHSIATSQFRKNFNSHFNYTQNNSTILNHTILNYTSVNTTINITAEEEIQQQPTEQQITLIPTNVYFIVPHYYKR